MTSSCVVDAEVTGAAAPSIITKSLAASGEKLEPSIDTGVPPLVGKDEAETEVTSTDMSCRASSASSPMHEPSPGRHPCRGFRFDALLRQLFIIFAFRRKLSQRTGIGPL